MDKITQERAALLHPKIRDRFFRGYEKVQLAKIGIRMVQSLRTISEQDKLYAIGRTVKGEGVSAEYPMGRVVTWARGGYSYHNYGLAFDFCLLHADKTISWKRDEDADNDHIADWLEVVDCFSSEGFEAGVNWPRPKQDPPHFQITFGYSVSTLRLMIAQAKVDSQGYLLL